MFKITFLRLSIVGLILRFYLLMAVVIIGFFTGQMWLAALGLPILLSAMLGIRFHKTGSTDTHQQPASIYNAAAH